jgi:hypothetical protein
MKTKLLCTMILLFLSSFSLTAKAEVPIDISTCNTVFLAHMLHGGHAYGLFCPSEGPNYIGIFMTMNSWSECYFSQATMSYRTNGSCTNPQIWRL